MPAREAKAPQPYYLREIHGAQIQLKDLVNAWRLGAWEAQAAQYIFRAKFKGSELDDLMKARDMIDYAIEALGAVKGEKK